MPFLILALNFTILPKTKTMYRLLLIFLAVINSATIIAQDVDYKKGVIFVDGKEYAKVEVTKQNFGLTKNFEVYSMSGKKLLIAAVATEFESDKNDNSYLFYRFTPLL